MSLAERWRTVHETGRWRWAAMVGAIAVGLLVSFFHWVGIALGGALCGLAARTRGRALLAGFGFGVLVWVMFAATLLANGDLGAYLAIGEQILGVSVAIPIVGATVAALVRWLI